MKRYQLEVTEEQLEMIADCVEDMHRFMAGEMGLYNATDMLERHHRLQGELAQLHNFVAPALPKYSSYPWNGGDCPNDAQRKFIAQSYALYREIRHRLMVTRNERRDDVMYNVYTMPTMTCEEGGKLPKVNLIEE